MLFDRPVCAVCECAGLLQVYVCVCARACVSVSFLKDNPAHPKQVPYHETTVTQRSITPPSCQLLVSCYGMVVASTVATTMVW